MRLCYLWILAVVCSSLGNGVVGAPVVHDPQFQIELHATLPGLVGGMATYRGDRFAEGLYATSGDDIYHLSHSGAYSLFASGLPYGTHEPAFDPSGDFGGDLFVTGIELGGGSGDRIVRVTPSGTVSTFHTSPDLQLDYLTGGLAFGPGTSGWDTRLYVPDREHHTFQVFNAEAGRTSLGSFALGNVDRIDVEFSRGGGWGIHAFVADPQKNGLWRISSDSSKATFSSGYTMQSIDFGEGGLFGDDLYAGTSAGELFRIDSSGLRTLLVSGFDGSINGTEFGDGALFVSEGNNIWKITPEPSTALLFVVSSVLFRRRHI